MRVRVELLVLVLIVVAQLDCQETSSEDGKHSVTGAIVLHLTCTY